MNRTTDDEPSGLRSRSLLTTALLLTSIAWLAMPRLIQTVQVEKSKSSIAVASQGGTALAGWSLKLLFYATIIVCLWVVVARWRTVPAVHGVALAATVSWPVYLTFRDLYAGQGADRTVLLVVVVIVALWMLRPRIRDLAVLGYVTGGVALVSVVSGFLLPTHAIWRSSLSNDFIDTDKAILPLGVLVGIFPNGNQLGVYLVISLPFVLLIPHRRRRWAILAVTLFALLWSASRGSFLAVGLTAVTALLVARSPVGLRKAVGASCCIAVAGLAAVLPWITEDPAAFTNRGGIWAGSITAWQTSPLVGLGTAWYRITGSTSGALGGAYHAHNQFLQALVTGGVIELMLLIWLLLALGVAAIRLIGLGFIAPTAFVVALIGSFVLEVPMALENTSSLVAWLVPLGVIVFTRDLDGPAHQPGPGPLRERARRVTYDPRRTTHDVQRTRV